MQINTLGQLTITLPISPLDVNNVLIQITNIERALDQILKNLVRSGTETGRVITSGIGGVLDPTRPLILVVGGAGCVGPSALIQYTRYGEAGNGVKSPGGQGADTLEVGIQNNHFLGLLVRSTSGGQVR